MRPCAYSYVHARITKTQYHRTGRSPGWRRPPISGTAQPRAQEHRCRAGAVCSAVVTARFLKGILLSHASHACDHTHTPIHTHTLQTIETTGQIPTPPACSTPLGTIERFFAGAAEQHGKTAAPPANARPSPRVARALTPPARTQRTPQCTPPVTARSGPAHAAAPAAACARPAPHSPAPKTMPCF